MTEIYEGSDGRYYTGFEIGGKYESHEWSFCMGETDTGRELVETENQELLMLAPTTASALPDGVTVKREGVGTVVVDDRPEDALAEAETESDEARPQ